MEKFLDLSDFRCPLAFVRCKAALLKLPIGHSLHVVLADPSSIEDIIDWAVRHSLHYERVKTHNGVELRFSRS
ncbi:sulfurtransferase TusA family protein [Echinimonas agarilytica]|uniref:sulfurtransferase TusA family protein n=1 Tax=Echinimonas agarilytica TaxID=1215918 RepID=UPI003D80FC6E